MDNYEDALLAACNLIIIMSAILLIQKQRRFWVHPILQRRKKLGEFNRLINELRIERPMQFYQYHRMNEAIFNKLVDILSPRLSKFSKREPIMPNERLSVTLRYLATGDSIQTIAWNYRLGASTVHNIIYETCDAIWDVLKDTALKPPSTEDWVEISKNFYEIWNFPNVLGCIDGKHIIIQQPSHGGSEYYNYKGTNSIVLLGIADALYRFIVVDIGKNGRISDGGVFSRSAFFDALSRNALGIPEPKALPGTSTVLPHVFLADDAFPLRDDLMKPFKKLNTDMNKVFNYRLSRARRIIENTFGILASKWRIFRRPIIIKDAKNAEAIVRAAVCLHNYLRNVDIEINKNWYANESFVSSNSTENPLENVAGFLPFVHQGGNRVRMSATDIRIKFAEYFVTEQGSVPWQNKVINRGRKRRLDEA